WAKYLMLIGTGIFLLDRCYQLGRRFAWRQVPLFAGTLVLFVFIVWIIKQDRLRSATRGRSRTKSPPP
ncbi:MAG: hypothetical protein ACREFX_08180, partial [Opitutaceae bacterium]